MVVTVRDPRAYEQAHGILENKRDFLRSMRQETVTDLAINNDTVELDAGISSMSVIPSPLNLLLR